MPAGGTLRARARRVGGGIAWWTRRLLKRPAWNVLWPGSHPVAVQYPPGHHYSPLPSSRDIAEATACEVAEWSPDALQAIDLRHEAQRRLLEQLDITEPTGPRWTPNTYFSADDTAIYQALLRHLRPRRVIEIGSGYSTAALLDAHVPDSVVLVEPYPERVRVVLRPEDWRRCTLLEARLQDVELSMFATLGDGDLLFVDSTHVSKLNSDVNRIVFDVLPRLAPGVVVHFHDVMYPFEYRQDWIDEGWAWNEAYLLRAFLQYNQAFEILLWPGMLRAAGDLPGGYGSLWLRRAPVTSPP
jgi:predicted O-methyltransferase YrrM